MFIFLCFIFRLFSLINCEFQPNFIVVLTDDVDLTLNSIISMKDTLKLIANEGITFTQAYVNSPICCPSRGSILTGKYSHNLQIYNNSLVGGCSNQNWQRNHENTTIATVLQLKKNYKTFYAGKYLNQYGDESVGGLGHVPPGWDWWLGLKGNSKYYNYSLSVNGTAKYYKTEYLTDKITEEALNFLDFNKNRFFMMLAPPAAHAPFVPAPRHAEKFPKVTADRKVPFNCTPVQKHWLVGMPPDYLPANVTILDDIHRNRLRTLQAVDEMVSKIIQKLELLQVINNTFVIFTSDNGFHIGQFSQPWDKRQPYESDIHIPFLIRGPGIARKTVSDYPIAAVDLAPTILDLAGDEMGQTDGKSFKNRLFSAQSGDFERFLLVEYWGEGNGQSVDSECPWGRDPNLAECSVRSWCKCQDSRNNTYSCVLHMTGTVKLKFCRFPNEFYEIYDLVTDSLELVNLYETFPLEQFVHYGRILDELTKPQF